MSAPHQRTVLITGAAGGIGHRTAEVFSAAGYRLLLTDRDEQRLQSVRDALVADGADVDGIAADLSDAASVEQLFSTLRSRHERLDAAFNNAGVGAGRKSLTDLSEDEWFLCMNSNLNGTWRCMKQEILWMLETGGGRIVNNASIFALNGGPSAAYTAAKHGIAGLTRSAALTYAAKGIRVNAICPGLIEAGLGLRAIANPADPKLDPVSLHPVGRAGQADEVAQAALWLCSDQASFVHGHLLAVDGGYSAR